jgi:hypothetical protein
MRRALVVAPVEVLVEQGAERAVVPVVALAVAVAADLVVAQEAQVAVVPVVALAAAVVPAVTGREAQEVAAPAVSVRARRQVAKVAKAAMATVVPAPMHRRPGSRTRPMHPPRPWPTPTRIPPWQQPLRLPNPATVQVTAPATVRVMARVTARVTVVPMAPVTEVAMVPVPVKAATYSMICLRGAAVRPADLPPFLSFAGMPEIHFRFIFVTDAASARGRDCLVAAT